MADYFHILPSFSLTKATSPASTIPNADVQSTPVDEKCPAVSASPARSLSRLIRGANGILSGRKDIKPEWEREEARKLGERKQILALRMKNVSLYFWPAD